MDQNELETTNSSNGEVDQEATSEAVSEETQDTGDTESEDPKDKLNKQLYARAKKAEEELKALKAKPTQRSEPTKSGDLTPRDVVALINNKVHQDDFDEVTAYAKFKGVTVSEALKDNVVKNILREKDEERKVASATSTGTSRRSNSKASAEDLLEKALRSGELPDGDDDIAKLVEARFQKNKGQK